MKSHEHYKSIQKKLLLFGLAPAGTIMAICGPLSGALNNEVLLTIAVILLNVCIGIGIAEIVLAVLAGKASNPSSSNNARKTSNGPRADSSNGTNNSGGDYSGFNGSTYNNASWTNKRSLPDATIMRFDEYVSKNYPQLPLDQFNERLKGTAIEDVRELALKMQKHLKIDQFVIIIEYANMSNEHEAGLFIRDNLIASTIKISRTLIKPQIEATLAHEISHAFQSFSGKPLYDANDVNLSEKFTDILTFYLGFDKMVEGGYYTNFSDHTSKLGYVESGDFINARDTYGKRTSSINSFKKDKRELEGYLGAYEGYISSICLLCEQMQTKFMPADDKKFVVDCLNKYSSSEISDFIKKTRANLNREAYMNIKMDLIGIEIKIESIMEDYKKIERFAE